MPTVRSSDSRGGAAFCCFADNPFFVLAVQPTASLAEIVTAANRWLDALRRGDPAARTYATPVGPRARTQTLVQHAVTRLRDRDARVQYEIWAAADPADLPEALTESTDGFSGAPRAFGWRGR